MRKHVTNTHYSTKLECALSHTAPNRFTRFSKTSMLSAQDALHYLLRLTARAPAPALLSRPPGALTSTSSALISTAWPLPLDATTSPSTDTDAPAPPQLFTASKPGTSLSTTTYKARLQRRVGGGGGGREELLRKPLPGGTTEGHPAVTLTLHVGTSTTS